MNFFKKIKNSIKTEFWLFSNNLGNKYKFLSLKQNEGTNLSNSIFSSNDNLLKSSLTNLKQESDINKLYESLQLYEQNKNSNIKEEAEFIYLEILNDKIFLDNLSITDLSKIYYYIYNLNNICQKEINKLNEIYIKKHNDIMVERHEHILLLDSLYFPEHKGFDVDAVKTVAITNINNYFETFKYQEMTTILIAILFMKEVDINRITKIISYYENNVMNLKKDMTLSIENRLHLLQFYPKILKCCLDDKVKKQQITKFANFFNSIVNDKQNIESLLCVVTNFCHFLDYRVDMVDKTAKLLKPHIYDVKEDMLLEFLFTILQFSSKPSNIVQEILKDITILIKNLKYTKFDLSGLRKDFIYFRENIEKLDKAYIKWSSEKVLQGDQKHFELFNILVKCSLESIPFTMLNVNDENFDKMYENFKKWVSI
jgi:hypothetical protein